MSTIKIKMYHVGPLGTNCFLVWDDESTEAMLIDPGAYEPVIDRLIAEKGLIVKYIVLTHGHYDHIDGVSEFKEAYPEAMLAASPLDSELLGVLIPEIALEENGELKLGELSFGVLPTPGHTQGSLCLYVQEWDNELIDQNFSGTLFSGDTLFHNSVGRTDLKGGDFETLKSSIREKLFELPGDTIVLPGHMDATTIGQEKHNNIFFRYK